MIWRHTFLVHGDDPFPIDMLRYDQCWPEEEEDSVIIDESYAYPSEKLVTLVHLSADRNWQPTAERWRSYRWPVHDQGHVVEKWGGQ